MPTFVELQNRLKPQHQTRVRLGTDEVLIADARAAMRSGDFIDEKLRAALGSGLHRRPADLPGQRSGETISDGTP